MLENIDRPPSWKILEILQSFKLEEEWAKKLFSVHILIFYHLVISSCGNHKFIKQAYNLDWSDINAGLCICFLCKPGFY